MHHCTHLRADLPVELCILDAGLAEGLRHNGDLGRAHAAEQSGGWA